MPVGQLPTKPYNVLADISAADCSGAPWGCGVYGNVDRALDTLKRKAGAMNADSIILRLVPRDAVSTVR